MARFSFVIILGILCASSIVHGATIPLGGLKGISNLVPKPVGGNFLQNVRKPNVILPAGPTSLKPSTVVQKPLGQLSNSVAAVSIPSASPSSSAPSIEVASSGNISPGGVDVNQYVTDLEHLEAEFFQNAGAVGTGIGNAVGEATSAVVDEVKSVPSVLDRSSANVLKDVQDFKGQLDSFAGTGGKLVVPSITDGMNSVGTLINDVSHTANDVIFDPVTGLTGTVDAISKYVGETIPETQETVNSVVDKIPSTVDKISVAVAEIVPENTGPILPDYIIAPLDQSVTGIKDAASNVIGTVSNTAEELNDFWKRAIKNLNLPYGTGK